jgi:hypothetical protein
LMARAAASCMLALRRCRHSCCSTVVTATAMVTTTTNPLQNLRRTI